MSPANAVSFNPAMYGMGVAADGTLWTTGTIYNLPSSPYNFGAGPVSSTGSADAFLNKVDPTGLTATQSFTFGFSGGADQVGFGVSVSGGGGNNVGVIGTYFTHIDFDPNAAAASDSGPTDNLDYLEKASTAIGAPMNYYLVASGASVMPEVTPIKAHNVDVGAGQLLAIASNPSQNKFAICGKTSQLLPKYVATNTSNVGLLTAGWGGTGSGSPITGAATYGGNMDVVVAVIDASGGQPTSGQVLWGRQFGGVGDQACQSVAMDSAGNVVIGGTYNGALAFGTTPALTLPTVGTSNLGLPFVAVLDPNGTVLQAATWGTSGVSDVYGVAVDNSSPANIVIAGDIGATITMGSKTVTDLGLKTNGFVAKLNSSLVPQWAMSFGDAAFPSAVKAVSLSSSGNVFIGGAFEGTLNGLNGLAASGNSALDAFTAELSGTDGSVLCAQTYGDAPGTQQAFAVTVASAATGTLADSVMIGGSFTSTVALGSTTLLSPGNVCSVNPDCEGEGLNCSDGHCVSAGVARSFISRLIP
jgi:hypothetical protein